MQNVSTTKFAEMCGCSEANIRRLIADSKLAASKDELNNWNIDLDDLKNREYYNKRKGMTQQSGSLAEQLAQENAQLSNDIVATLAKQIEELARQAGKAELLTDNIIEQKKDVEYWRNKYFELQRDCDTLRIENERLKNDPEKLDIIRDLQEKNKKLAIYKDEIQTKLENLTKDHETLQQEHEAVRNKCGELEAAAHQTKQKTFLGFKIGL